MIFYVVTLTLEVLLIVAIYTWLLPASYVVFLTTLVMNYVLLGQSWKLRVKKAEKVLENLEIIHTYRIDELSNKSLFNLKA